LNSLLGLSVGDYQGTNLVVQQTKPELMPPTYAR